MSRSLNEILIYCFSIIRNFNENLHCRRQSKSSSMKIYGDQLTPASIYADATVNTGRGKEQRVQREREREWVAEWESASVRELSKLKLSLCFCFFFVAFVVVVLVVVWCQQRNFFCLMNCSARLIYAKCLGREGGRGTVAMARMKFICNWCAHR